MELHVKAVNGKYLPKSKFDTTDPYLRLTLLDKHGKKSTTIEEKTTTPISNSTDPEWNQEFHFGIRSIESNYLHVTLLDRDDRNKDDFMAEFELALEALSYGEVLEIKQKLPKPKGSKHSPIVNIQLFICKKGMTPWVDAPFTPQVLKLTVVEAKDVPKMDLIGKSDPYITMNWRESSKKYKTPVIPNTFEPQWNSSFDIRITDIENDVLIMTMKDDDKAGVNDPISNFELKAAELTPGQQVDRWVDFTPLKKKTGGSVHLIYTLEGGQPVEAITPAPEKKKKHHKHRSSKKSTDEGKEEASVVAEPEPEHIVEEVVEQVVEEKVEEKPEEKAEENEPKVLNFKIIEAKDLPAADADGGSDPYAQCVYGKEKAKTEVIKNDRTPKWDYVGRMPINDEENDIGFEVYDYDMLGKNDCLGKIEFKTETFVTGQVTDRWYPLTNKKGDLTGQIHLVLHLAKESDVPFEGDALPAEPPAKLDDEWTYEYYYVYGTGKSLSSYSSSDKKAKSLSSYSTSDKEAKSLSSSEFKEKRKRKILKSQKKQKKSSKKVEFVLNLKVVEAKDVPAADANGKCDPYIKVRINTDEKKTKAIQNTLEPVWNETFELPILDRNSDTLFFALWDEDLSNDDELAHLKFKVRDLVPGRVCDQWFMMKNMKGHKNTQLHLVLHLGEKGKPAFEESEIQAMVLNVRVIEGAEIPKADAVGKSDPFVKLGIHGGAVTDKTKVCENSDTPQWGEQFQICLTDPASDVVVFQLWDHDVSNDDQISSVQIPVGKLPAGQIVNDWWTLEPEKKFKTGGRLHLELQVAGANQATFE